MTPLQRLLKLLTTEILRLTAPLTDGVSSAVVETWYDRMRQTLVKYHTAAALVGSGQTTLTDAARRAIAETVNVQLQFLDRFRLEVQTDRQFDAGRLKRAASYARSIKAPYWRGAVKFLPLPAMPTEGTICGGNCKCAWEIVVVDDERGDYDCYWRRAADDSCSTCMARESQWNPLRVRDGRVV